MREILFRDKRTDNGEWVYGYLCKGYSMSAPHTFDGIMYENHSGINLAYMTAQIDPETVGQYTGLKDRNGKKIFEGDVVMGIGKVKEVVEFEQGEFQLSTASGQKYLIALAANMWVIGNIHNNPELIGGEK